MFIFGWGFQTIKNFGPVFQNHCGHCNNDEYWVLTRYITWFTLFFIPVFPYSIKHTLSCPICHYGLTLTGQQVEQMKPLAEGNQLLIEGKITQAEYQSRISQLGGGTTASVTASPVVQQISGGTSLPGVCPSCGINAGVGIKFCKNCGVKI